MPKRTNEFQKIVAYIYSQIAPAGGHVTESALIREDGTGAEREVDVLVEHKVAGHDIKIAVECRDHAADQNVVWVDALIGKYSRLGVHKIVAISSSPFSEAAKIKAAKHNIDAITVNEALTTDWVKRIERWRAMTHSFTLMRIVAEDAHGNVLTWSDVSEDGSTATHRDQKSEAMFSVLLSYFMRHLSKDVAQAVDAKIAENWQQHVDHPIKRWCEFTAEKPPRIVDHEGKDVGVEKIVFGVGVFFHVGAPGDHFALKEHALSQIKIPLMKGEATFKMITDPAGKLLTLDVPVKTVGEAGDRSDGQV